MPSVPWQRNNTDGKCIMLLHYIRTLDISTMPGLMKVKHCIKLRPVQASDMLTFSDSTCLSGLSSIMQTGLTDGATYDFHCMAMVYRCSPDSQQDVFFPSERKSLIQKIIFLIFRHDSEKWVISNF